MNYEERVFAVIFIISVTFTAMVLLEPYWIRGRRGLKRLFCRHRQGLMPIGTAVIYRGKLTTVSAWKYNCKGWWYQLHGHEDKWVPGRFIRERKMK
jgi:hypothetical protein